MKKTVLLNWDTTRKDLLEPFIALKDDVDFVIIWGDRSVNDRDNHPFRQVYFTDYKTPYQLLEAVRPDKVLLFNINSFTHVALNLAAKNRGIPTYTMHHGIHHADLIEMNIVREKVGLHKKRRLVSSTQTLRFYFSALRWRNVGQFYSFVRFAWIRQKRDRLLAANKSIFDARLPDHYINLSPHNAMLAKRVDRIQSDEKFIYIGHPFFDGILTRLNELKERNGQAQENYFLLIDFPNIENHLSFKLMTAGRKRNFYKKLSALAKSEGCRLKIKLHPFGFDSPHNYKDDNIDLVYEADMAPLIHYAKKCFSFFSTLIIPIIYHKGTCFIIHIGDDRQLQKDLVELGVARKLDADDFDAADIAEVPGDAVSEKAYQVFVERYLYYTDGKATERLKNILLS